jgi:hypothetical protein
MFLFVTLSISYSCLFLVYYDAWSIPLPIMFCRAGAGLLFCLPLHLPHSAGMMPSVVY